MRSLPKEADIANRFHSGNEEPFGGFLMFETIATSVATQSTNHAAGDVLGALMTSQPGAVALFLFGFMFLIVGGVILGLRGYFVAPVAAQLTATHPGRHSA